ncbi:MAG: protein kinase [Acidobacteriota bacterium]
MSLAPGTRLGPYDIVSAIGAGGMGEVYKAKDPRLGRDVAIKVLPLSFADDPGRRARFEREAQAVAALSHPNVIAIFDTGLHEPETSSGGLGQAGPGQAAVYIVMELLAGQTLRERLSGGALPVRKAVDIAVQIARGLGAAHGKLIVHRDLKPENIFLLDDGQVKILDFGLARHATAAENSGGMQTMAATDPGSVLGTVGYMAPEQVRGQAVDARADLFALGAVLYEMVSGQRAYQRDTAADTMTAILTLDPPELVGSRPDLSPALDRIIRHCLEKNVNERFQNARDIAFALEALSGSASGTALSGAAVVGSARRPRARLLIASAVVAALVLGASAGYLGRGASAPKSAGAADLTFKPVSFEDGFVFAARFAADGRTIVYSADWERQPRGVYLTSVDSSEYRSLGFPGADLLGVSRSGELAILNESAVSAGNPYWRIGTLAKGSLTGGARRPELERVRFADFGPNNTVAVVRDDAHSQALEYPVGHVLAEVPVTAGRTSEGMSIYAAPRVSPSGAHVAYFDLHVASAYRVNIVDRSGTLVTQSSPFFDWWALAWTPSNEVWFAATETSGRQTTIFSLDLAGHQRPVFRAPGAITLHDISAEGDALVSFDRISSRIEVVEGSDPTPLDRSWRESATLTAFSTSHTLLFDGSGDSGGFLGSVYAWQPKEAQPVRIADGSGVGLSPDGKKALVRSLQTPPKLSIVPTGTGQPQIVDMGPVEVVSWGGWLPDGRLVIQATRPGSRPSVFILSADGRQITTLLPGGVTLPVMGTNLISPDGSRIVAVDAAGKVVTCTITKPVCHPVAGTLDGDNVAGWSADGQSLFVYQRQLVEGKIDRLDVASGRRSAWKTVHPLKSLVSGLSNLIVSPSGATAYGYNRDASQLYVIKGLK